MKTYTLDPMSSLAEAKATLSSILPGQESPWVLLTTDGTTIAYFNVVEADPEFVGPTVIADISGRQYHADERVLAILAALRQRVGGAIECSP